MNINYYTKTVFKGSTELRQGESIIVDDSTKAFVCTICLNVSLGHEYLTEVVNLQLEESGALSLESPSQNAKDLVTKLNDWKENYLKFPQSYISLSRIRPYGVGINIGDVTKSAVQVKDIMDAFTEPSELFFKKPVFRRSKDDSIVFHKRAPFSRKFNVEVQMPVMSNESLESMLKTKKDMNIGSVQRWCKGSYPGKKVRVTNNGYLNSVLPTRRWVPFKRDQSSDHYVYFQVKREVMENSRS